MAAFVTRFWIATTRLKRRCAPFLTASMGCYSIQVDAPVHRFCVLCCSLNGFHSRCQRSVGLGVGARVLQCEWRIRRLHYVSLPKVRQKVRKYQRGGVQVSNFYTDGRASNGGCWYWKKTTKQKNRRAKATRATRWMLTMTMMINDVDVFAKVTIVGDRWFLAFFAAQGEHEPCTLSSPDWVE